MRSSSLGDRGRAGFTLLETLAAVVMMLLFYGILSTQGLLGFELEGDAERRLEASLIADRHLADLQVAIARGAPPILGTTEDRDGGYDVRVDVGPLALPWAVPTEDEGGRGRRRTETPSLLSNARSTDPTPVLAVRVTVAWNDGRERAVQRTTFALDPEAITSTLEQAGVLGTDAEGNPVFGTSAFDAAADPDRGER